MKQLFDIGKKVLNDPTYTPESSEYNLVSKGIVCVLPDFPAMYEQYTFPVLFSTNATTQASLASTTKVMSLVTGLPYISNIKEKVTLVSGDIQSGSGNYFSAGDVLTIEDLIYGMMLPSSNTCAAAFAHYIGGLLLGNNSASASDCISAFVAEMNAKAALLGCSNTTFDSPSGLSASSKSTAMDMLRFTIEACSIPAILRIWNKKSYTINIGGTNARTQAIATTVTNETLESSYYIFGGKTGHLSTANALVMVAESK